MIEKNVFAKRLHSGRTLDDELYAISLPIENTDLLKLDHMFNLGLVDSADIAQEIISPFRIKRHGLPEEIYVVRNPDKITWDAFLKYM